MQKIMYYVKNKRTSKDNKYVLSNKSFYHVIYISKGSCTVAHSGNQQRCSADDIIFIKPNANVKILPSTKGTDFETLEMGISKEGLAFLSSENTDLVNAFSFVPFEVGVIRSYNSDTIMIRNILTNLTRSDETKLLFGQDLYEKNMYSLALIYIIRAAISSDAVHRRAQKKRLLMDDIFVYIKMNLTEDLSLEKIGQYFNVNPDYLCREFKKKTGESLHQYILKSRLDLCKKYIEQGLAITEVYERGGFNSYNHFFKAFKKEYGMTPKQYFNFLQQNKQYPY